MDFDVAPKGRHRVGRQVGDHDRIGRIRDVDEARAGGAAKDGVLRAVRRVDPTPNVIHIPAPHFVA